MKDETDRRPLSDSSFILHPSSFREGGPAAEYQRRLAAARGGHDLLERRLAWLGNLRFALVVAAVVLLWLTLRERLALLGAGGAAAVETTPLAAWGAAPVGRPAPLARLVAPFLVGLTLALLAGWAVGLDRAPVLAALLLQIAFALWLRPRV